MATDGDGSAETTNTVSGTPVWLNVVAEPLYAVLHEPEVDRTRDLAVLMLPMFGWDECCSYRARRQWAVSLAEAGFPTVRFDLPGSEDSVGQPLDEGRFDSWLAAVSAMAAWLREVSGARRVAAVGVGIGTLIAAAAIDSGAEIDDLILWGAPPSGRAHMRELRLLASAMAVDGSEPDRSDGALAVGGYLLSAETAGRLKNADGAPAVNSGRSVLLIARDAQGVDDRLQNLFSSTGADLSVLECADDYTAMVTFPDRSEVPTETIGTSIRWLESQSGVNRKARALSDSPAVAREICFNFDGRVIRERHVTFETPAGKLVGILSEPADGKRGSLCLLSHNSGALRRTGPARLWTDTCRRWTARGLPVLRVDFAGIADSSGSFVLNADRTPEDENRTITSRIEIADVLERDGIASEFISIGLCLGSFWEMKVATRDSRLRGVVLLNHPTFDGSPAQLLERQRRERLGMLNIVRHGFKTHPDGSRLLSVASIPRLGRGLLMTLRGVASTAQRSQIKAAEAQFDILASLGTRVLLVFATRELLHHQLRKAGLLDRLAKWPNIEIEQIPTADHEFRPLHGRRLLCERIDRFIGDLVAAQAS